MRQRQRTRKSDTTPVTTELQHSQVQTGNIDGRDPPERLKLMAARFGPGGANPGETIGYAAFIETLVLVVHPIVNS